MARKFQNLAIFDNKLKDKNTLKYQESRILDITSRKRISEIFPHFLNSLIGEETWRLESSSQKASTVLRIS
ncbi:unnamed protein product, partial [Allacma fusca]